MPNTFPPEPLPHQREKLLTSAQVARRWSLSERSLERWRSQGRGPRFLRLHGVIRYRREDIESFEAEQLAAAEAQLSVRKQGEAK